MKRISLLLMALLFTLSINSQTLEWHVKDNYAEVEYMGNGLFKVKNFNDKWGLVNAYGELTVDVKYDNITSFVENRALLLDQSDYLKGIVNERGQVVKYFNKGEVIAKYPYFSEGMLAFGIPAGEYYQYGYLDINGNVSIAPMFFWAAPFSDGKASVQYQSTRFGLINKSGTNAMLDNRTITFLSTPVNNQSLLAVQSASGDKLSIVSLGSDGRLKEVEKLENKVYLKRSLDNTRIDSSPNNHSYHFDDAMRLISSSEGRVFNNPLVHNAYPSSATLITKVKEQLGWAIQYSGKTLLHTSFKDIIFYDDEYAVVTTQRNTKGVLKLNAWGEVSLQNIPSLVEFWHNEPVRRQISVNIDGLLPSTRIQIGLVGLNEYDQEERISVPEGFNGVYNHPISYFIPAEDYEHEVSIPIKINLYIDGMLYKTENSVLAGLHKKPFYVSEASAPVYSDPDGNAIVSFSVQSLHSSPSSSAKVTINGSQVKRFNGDKIIYFKYPVSVPEDEEKTFSYVVKVTEDGCPPCSKTIRVTIKHYDLQ